MYFILILSFNCTYREIRFNLLKIKNTLITDKVLLFPFLLKVHTS